MSTEIIYTDGACSKNGTANATGGFGVFIAKSAIFDAPIKLNAKGMAMTFKEDQFYVTNIRMEGLAIVSTLALYTDVLITEPSDKPIDPIQRLNENVSFATSNMKPGYGPDELRADADTSVSVEIVTDSLFWINVIESWMPTWIRKGIVMEKKNPDILLMMLFYVERLRQSGVKVVFTHVKSHQKGARTAHADGNDVADVLATSAVQNPSTAFYKM